ncbi:MAG: hypothetical protein VB095_00975 [Anaerovorax sp.]|nr:hypothetical protein [Anaerovorax sp.]
MVLTILLLVIDFFKREEMVKNMEKNKIKIVSGKLQSLEAMCLGKKGMDIILNGKFFKYLDDNLSSIFFYKDILTHDVETTQINSTDIFMINDEAILENYRQRIWRVPLTNYPKYINIKRKVVKMKLKELVKNRK